MRNLIKIGDAALDLDTPAVMAIVNVTPDSFYPGGRRWTDDEIAAAVTKAVDGGAAIIDLGGYSSRPGADDVSPEEEWRRVERGMEIVRRNHPGFPVSVDTFRAEVVRRVVGKFGPVAVNDISAGELDPDMIPAVAGLGLPYIAMHMRDTPAAMQQYVQYDDVTVEIKEYFARKIEQLRAAGIEQIVLDPGFGFAKTTRQNYLLLGRMNELLDLGYPLLAGVSRKSMIYKVLDATPEDALAGTAALHWECLRQGASVLRVHDVKEAADVIRIYNYYTENGEDE